MSDLEHMLGDDQAQRRIPHERQRLLMLPGRMLRRPRRMRQRPPQQLPIPKPMPQPPLERG